MPAIYQGDKKIVDRYVGETLVTRAYQGDKLIFDAYSELSDTLPLIVHSRASQVLKNYIIFGESVQDGTPTPENPVEVAGLGVRTANLFDKDTYLRNGTPTQYSQVYMNKLTLKPNTTYTLSSNVPLAGSTNHLYITNNESLTGYAIVYNNHPATFTTNPDGSIYFMYGTRIYYNNLLNGTYYVMLTEGSTVPTEFIPYGYKLPLKVIAGGTTTDYPVYIGDSQLMEGEYVNYEEQKIYKLVDGVLTPTDPPEPFPDITIPEGEVTIDIEGDLKPQATIKGRINPVHYAYHVDPTISNPSDAVTYLADAIGKTPASMGVSAFNYGDWANVFFMPKPCMLGFDGKVKYYLDPNDYSKKLDGTDSDYDNLAFEGNVMLEFPLIWWKFEAGETEGEGYFHVSNVQIDDSYKCWCNINSKGEQINHFYMAAYNGCIYDGKMRSISGLQLLPWSTTAYSDTATYAVGARVHNGNKMYQCITAIEEAEPFDETKWEQFAYNGQTAGQEEVDACIALNTSNSIEWYTDVYADRVLINGLLTLISKSLNSQAVFGRGLDSGSQAAKENYTTGTLNNKGLFYGVTANGNNAVKVFGIENWWGCVWRRTAGLIGASTGYKYKLTYDTSDGTTVSGYNSTANGYKVCNTQQPANGYVTKMQYGDWGFVPMTTSGASTTYYSDYYYRGNGFALFGGGSSYGVNYGTWCLSLIGGFAYRHWSITAAPSCKPLV